MANVFLVSHILLLFHSPRGSWIKSAKYEKFGKYWPYCAQNRAITNAYIYTYDVSSLFYFWFMLHLHVPSIWLVSMIRRVLVWKKIYWTNEGCQKVDKIFGLIFSCITLFWFYYSTENECWSHWSVSEVFVFSFRCL